MQKTWFLHNYILILNYENHLIPGNCEKARENDMSR